MITFSIVVCTFNRADLLDGLLQSVADQYPIPATYEVLIIDNGSTDNTKMIVSKYAESIPNLRYVFEEKVGLSNARNRGWEEAKGNYVGYLDDDAKIPPEWVQVALEIATEVKPVAFGGPYFAFYNSPKPRWFKDEYASHSLGEKPLFLDRYGFLTGGNMFIRRECLERLGGFNSQFGMVGNQLAYGEESKFFVDLRHQFPDTKIFYDPRLFINHLVRPEKMTFKDMPYRWITNGIYSFRVLHDIDISEKGNEKEGIVYQSRLFAKDVFLLGRHLSWLIYSFSIGLLFRDRSRFPFIENYIYEKLRYFYMEIGRRVESIRQIFSMRVKR